MFTELVKYENEVKPDHDDNQGRAHPEEGSDPLDDESGSQEYRDKTDEIEEYPCADV
jgi:hypothetical protein